MTPQLALQNLTAYSLQVAVLVVGGSAALVVARLSEPRVRLACLHLLFALCLAAPLLQPWHLPLAGDGQVEISTALTVVRDEAPAAPAPQVDWKRAMLAVLGAGVVLRLGWLVLGCWRIRRYVRAARPLHPLPDAVAVAQARVGTTAQFWLSAEVTGPITFGVARPEILLPESFLEMEPAMQEALACHELLHVRRRDSALTMFEEVLRSVFWFHPAIWWLLGQIHLAREQAVDRAVVEATRERQPYLEALLAVAGVKAGLDLAPAPLFLRKRHLAQRVALLLKEATMSKRRLASSLATVLLTIGGTAFMGTQWFPLQAAPHDPGVSVTQGSMRLLHGAPVKYPELALAKHIEGTVMLEITVDTKGVVTDAKVVSGPEELRVAALQAVLQWHYANETGAVGRMPVSINFTVPAERAKRPVVETVSNSLGVYKGLQFYGVEAAMQQQIRNRITLAEGQPMTAENANQIMAAVRESDEHLRWTFRVRGGETMVEISLSPNMSMPASTGQDPMTVGGNKMAMNLIERVRPAYPPEAKAARIQGLVRLKAVIGKDGHVTHLELEAGHPLLATSAIEAVRQWVYKPMIVNEVPVEVQTMIDVNYTLSQ